MSTLSLGRLFRSPAPLKALYVVAFAIAIGAWVALSIGVTAVSAGLSATAVAPTGESCTRDECGRLAYGALLEIADSCGTRLAAEDGVRLVARIDAWLQRSGDRSTNDNARRIQSLRNAALALQKRPGDSAITIEAIDVSIAIAPSLLYALPLFSRDDVITFYGHRGRCIGRQIGWRTAGSTAPV